METNGKIIIPDKNCIKCQHFAWWDGDFCCTKHMKILQEAPDANFNDDILISISNNKDCEDYKEAEEGFAAGLLLSKFKEYLSKKLGRKLD